MTERNSVLSRRALLGAGVALVAAGPLSAQGRFRSGRDRTVTVAGTAYRYRQSDVGAGPPLLLLQRFRGTMDDWDPAFLGALSARRSLVLFDGAGVGGSGGRTPSTIAAMARDAAAVVRALGQRRVDVLGWSMGGFVAQELAAAEPNLVCRLVLVGTGPAGSPETPAPAEGVLKVATQPEWSAADRNYLFFAPTPRARRLGTASDARIAAGGRGPRILTEPDAMQAQAAAITAYLQGGEGAFSRLRSIASPTLIVAGDSDPFFPVLGATLLRREIPRSRLVVFPEAGHAPHHQHPAEVAAATLSFLAEADR